MQHLKKFKHHFSDPPPPPPRPPRKNNSSLTDDIINYDAHRLAFIRILKDRGQSDASLRERAQRYLTVLDAYAYGSDSYTIPSRKISTHLERMYFVTAKRTFETMYDVARKFDLPGAERYISASVCACTREACDIEGSTLDERKLANELVALACDVWIADILSICESFNDTSFLLVLLALELTIALSIKVSSLRHRHVDRILF